MSFQKRCHHIPCGTIFTAKRDRRRFCSDSCRAKASRASRKRETEAERELGAQRSLGPEVRSNLSRDVAPQKIRVRGTSAPDPKSLNNIDRTLVHLLARVSALESGGLFREDLRKLIQGLGQLQGQFHSEARRHQQEINRLQTRLRRAEVEAAKRSHQLDMLQETVEKLAGLEAPSSQS